MKAYQYVSPELLHIVNGAFTADIYIDDRFEYRKTPRKNAEKVGRSIYVSSIKQRLNSTGVGVMREISAVMTNPEWEDLGRRLSGYALECWWKVTIKDR